MMTGAFRLPVTTAGMMEASMTRRPRTALTRASVSTTPSSLAPIRQVPDAW
jgi:hypothetical protein